MVNTRAAKLPAGANDTLEFTSRSAATVGVALCREDTGAPAASWQEVNYQKRGGPRHYENATLLYARMAAGAARWIIRVAQIVNLLNGLTARDALCLLVGCMQAVLDETPSYEERQQSLEGCIDLLKRTRAKDRS